MKKANADNLCMCRACPSYVDCGELSYCYGSKSECIKKEAGCVCPACEVAVKDGLKHVFYCTRGNERQQGGKK